MRSGVTAFGRVLECVERVTPEAIEVVAQSIQPRGIELIDAIAAVAALADDTSLPEKTEMLRDGGAGHIEVVRELVHRVRPSTQVLEHGAPGRIGERPEGVRRI